MSRLTAGLAMVAREDKNPIRVGFAMDALHRLAAGCGGAAAEVCRGTWDPAVPCPFYHNLPRLSPQNLYRTLRNFEGETLGGFATGGGGGVGGGPDAELGESGRSGVGLEAEAVARLVPEHQIHGL